MERQLTAIEFVVDGEAVESVNHDSVPAVGDRIEIGARFDTDDERLDPGITDFDDYHDGQYRTVLEGEVTKVRRHYHTASSRSELTAYVHVETDDETFELFCETCHETFGRDAQNKPLEKAYGYGLCPSCSSPWLVPASAVGE